MGTDNRDLAFAIRKTGVTMKRPLPISTVGSFPKPGYLREARRGYARKIISADELHRMERKAIAETIRLQESLGIDVLVHGEHEREDMATYFGAHLENMGLSDWVHSYGNRYYRKPIVQGEIRRQEPITVGWFRYAQGLTDRPVKGMLTGPYTMMDWSFDEYYGNRRECTLAFARALRGEVEDLAKAGARWIQIDEPAFAVRPGETDIVIEGLGIMTAGIAGVTFATHICYGDFDDQYPRLLELPVTHYTLEMSKHIDTGDSRFLGALKKHRWNPDKDIGIGVVRIEEGVPLEPDKVVKQRIEKALDALDYMNPERIYVYPDCGFRAIKDPELAEAKLRHMVQAVNEIRKKRFH